MFELLYKDPETIAKYRLAPFLEERERYLRVVVASGVVDEVARRVARTQLALTDLLNLPDIEGRGDEIHLPWRCRRRTAMEGKSRPV